MSLRTLMQSAAVALILTLATGSATLAVAAEKKHGVVMQVSDNNPATWNLALNNAKNLQQALGKDNVNVEIVAYGPGLKMFMFDSEVANRLSDAEKSGVTLAACGNTMKAMKVSEKDLHAGVKVVPGGVIEIMEKQEAGWAYVKP
jgi:intracellular sulfur oxidation DsrE/DsrF family protein